MYFKFILNGRIEKKRKINDEIKEEKHENAIVLLEDVCLLFNSFDWQKIKIKPIAMKSPFIFFPRQEISYKYPSLVFYTGLYTGNILDFVLVKNDEKQKEIIFFKENDLIGYGKPF